MKTPLILSIILFAHCTVYCRIPPDSISTSRRDSILLAGIKEYSESKYEQAIRTFSSVPPESLGAPASFYIGLSCAALNDLQNANACLSATVSKDSLNVAYRYNLGQLLARQGDIDGAIGQYKRIVRLDSSFFPAYEQLGQLCELWQRETAPFRDSVWAQALSLRPNDYVALYYHGLAMFRDSLPDSGFVCLRKSVEQDSLFYAAVYELAVRHLAQRNVEQTLYWYDRAVRIRPRNSKLLSEVATLYGNAGKYRVASSFANKASTFDTANAEYAEQAGLLYYTLASFDTASRYLKRAVALEKDNWSYWFNLALAYTQMDSTRLAIQTYRRAIESFHFPDGSNLFYRLGRFQADKKLYSEAKKSYGRAIEIDPGNTELRLSLGYLYLSMDNIEQSKKELQKYLDSTSGDSTKSDSRKRVQQLFQYYFKTRKE